MPFNFIAHHSCRRRSRHLFYRNGECYGEEGGKERVGGTGMRRGECRKQACGQGARGGLVRAAAGMASRKQQSGAVQNQREASDKSTAQPLLLTSNLYFEVC